MYPPAVPTTVTLAVSGGNPPVFSDRCVGCGATATTSSNLAIAKVVTGPSGGQRPVRLTYAVPHCAACARSTKAVFLAQLIPFALGFLVVGGVALAGTWYGATIFGLDEVGQTNPRTPNSWVLAGAAGLFGGIVGGFVVELVARVALLPFFGAGLWKAPLLVPSLFTDSDRVAGLTAHVNADVTELRLTFDRDDAAREFAAANRRL
jgi:hypothetical protein